MALLEWNDQLSLHVEEIDVQHKSLVVMVNRLYDSMLEGASRQTLDDIIREMRTYAEVHFATEERYMKTFGYPEMAAHEKEHRDFEEKALQLENDHKSGKVALSMEIFNFLSDWIVTHISETDSAMGVFLRKKVS